MSWHHKYIGNPILSFLAKKFFGIEISDIHCGERALSKKAFEKMTLYTAGMEFASEMIIKAAKANLKITELPVSYEPRIGESKLRSFRDGWRHLRFIFLYSPLVLFLIPGIILFSIGLISILVLYFGTFSLGNIRLSLHPMFLSAGSIIAGYQLIYFALFAKTYAITHMGEKSELFETLFKYITIESAGITGMAFILCGTALYSFIVYHWIHQNFGSLNEIKNSIAALTLLVIGVQTISSSFMLSIIGIKER